jgi:hypothetical protein
MTGTYGRRALPLAGLTFEVGLVFSAQHAICLVHLGSVPGKRCKTVAP